MKKLLFITLLTTLALSSCLKDEEDNTYEAEVTIDGTKTTISDLIFYIYADGADKYYNISSANYDNTDIEISLFNPTTGTKAFSEDNTVSITIGSDTYSSTNTGSFTITEANESVVSGTFSGKFMHNGSQVQINGNFSAEQRRGEI
jgi:hypothetical protein